MRKLRAWAASAKRQPLRAALVAFPIVGAIVNLVLSGPDPVLIVVYVFAIIGALILAGNVKVSSTPSTSNPPQPPRCQR